MSKYSENKEILIKVITELKSDVIKKELLIEALEELDNMIGMEETKQRIIEMVCETVIDPYKTDTGNHCMILGAPGTGKTSFVDILSKILYALGISTEHGGVNEMTLNERSIFHRVAGLSFIRDQVTQIKEDIAITQSPSQLSTPLRRLEWIEEITSELIESGAPVMNKVKTQHFVPKIIKVGRYDVVGVFQGSSGVNMKKFYDQARGGILVFDEAYALVNADGNDSGDNYSVEVVDALNRLMSERTDTTVILAGYEDLIRDRLFKTQKGLESRIQYVFRIEPPTNRDMALMLKRRLPKCNVTIEEIEYLMVGRNMEGYGRTIAKWAKQSSLVSSTRRLLYKGDQNITIEDLREGLRRISNISDNTPSQMYS